MRPSELLDALRRRPFDIRHPELMHVGTASVTIVVREDPSSPYYDHIEIVAARHIIRMVPLEQPVTPDGNGAKE
jgi:hypothetical protein